MSVCSMSDKHIKNEPKECQVLASSIRIYDGNVWSLIQFIGREVGRIRDRA